MNHKTYLKEEMMNINKIKKEFADGIISKAAFIDKMYQVHTILFEYQKDLTNTNVSNIEVSEAGVIMTFRNSGLKFICAEGDKRLATFEALNFGDYEEDELNMQMQLIDSNDTIFDIGGNHGWYAIHMAKRFPNSKIYSFEPVPSTHEFMEKNIKINHVTNIKSYALGLSDVAGEFKLYIDPTLSVNASLQNVSGSSSVQKVICKIDTLNSFCETSQVNVDFIKCDVEGAELLCFKGGNDLLKKQTPIIFSEMLRKWTAKFNYHPNDIISFLKGFGYQCYVLADTSKLKAFVKVEDSTIETNYFFLHPEKHKEKIKQFVIQ